MLRKLTVQNFYSIADAQTLDLSIAKNVPDQIQRYGTPINGRTERFPRIVALFGANASGKTNVLRSLVFLVSFLRDSADWKPDEPLPFLTFEGRDWHNRTTKFQVEFDAQISPSHDKRIAYVYDLEIVGNKRKIQKESLRYYPEGRSRRLFDRRGKQIQTGEDFQLAKRDPIREKIRDNASVVSTFAKFNHAFSLAIYNGLSAIISNIGLVGSRLELLETPATKYYVENDSIFRMLNSEIKKFDLGISEVQIKTTAAGIRPYFLHHGIDTPMDYAFESHGTQRFYNLFPYLNFALAYGGLAILDEFDTDIHPLLLPELMRKFISHEHNKENAQLIISCHSPSIFEILEKDEVFFTEKCKDGRTEIYGLHDVKGVRRDTNIYAKYLAGAFGGIPRVG